MYLSYFYEDLMPGTIDTKVTCYLNTGINKNISCAYNKITFLSISFIWKENNYKLLIYGV